MNRIKKFMLTMAVACIGLVPAFGLANIAYAENISQNLCKGANISLTDNNCDQSSANAKIQSIANWIIDTFSWIVGIVSVIMIIWGGFKYMTSSGNDSNVTAAKNTILYAIVGLVIVALAQILVKFVLAKLTGTVNS